MCSRKHFQTIINVSSRPWSFYVFQDALYHLKIPQFAGFIECQKGLNTGSLQGTGIQELIRITSSRKQQEFDGQNSIVQGRVFCLELSAFFLTLLKDSIFAAGGKTVFIVEFINLQQVVKCGQRMRKIFGRGKNLPQKVSPQ